MMTDRKMRANCIGTLEFDLLTGGLDEWFKSHAWKACLG